jgi:hypothetical protein
MCFVNMIRKGPKVFATNWIFFVTVAFYQIPKFLFKGN